MYVRLYHIEKIDKSQKNCFVSNDHLSNLKKCMGIFGWNIWTKNAKNKYFYGIYFFEAP